MADPTLWELLNSFEHTAFRPEVRDRYYEQAEVEPLRQYLAGEPVDLTWLENWFDLVRAAATKDAFDLPPASKIRWGGP